MDNFFTSQNLIRYLREKSMEPTGTVRSSRRENPPFKTVDDINKTRRSELDVAEQILLNITVVRWKDSEIVKIFSIFVGKD